MGRTKGQFPFSGNLELQKGAPIDSRTVVEYKSDLINTGDIWNAKDGSKYLYDGLTVYVKDTDELYTLIDASNYSNSDYSSWKKIASDDDVKNLNDNVVKTSTDQTVNGKKTFTSEIISNSGINIVNKTFISSTIGPGELKVLIRGNDNYKNKGFIVRTISPDKNIPILELLSTNGRTSYNYDFPEKSGTVVLESDLNESINKIGESIDDIKDIIEDNEFAIATAIADISSVVEENGYVAAKSLTDLSKKIEDNEFIYTTAINELNSKIDSKQDNINKVTLSGDVQGSVQTNGSSEIIINTIVEDDSHEHISENISDKVNDGTGVTESNGSKLTTVKSVIEYSAIKKHSSNDDRFGIGTESKYGHVKVYRGDVDLDGQIDTDGVSVGINHTHGRYALKEELNNCAVKEHSSNSIEFGIGTESKYGHVKVSNGIVSETSKADGLAAGMGHSHGNYALSNDLNTHLSKKSSDNIEGHVTLIKGDLNGETYSVGKAAASSHEHGQYVLKNTLDTHVVFNSTTGSTGHSKLFTGDLSGKTYVEGEAAAASHEHGQYALNTWFIGLSSDFQTHYETESNNNGIVGHCSLKTGDLSGKTYVEGEAAAASHEHGQYALKDEIIKNELAVSESINTLFDKVEKLTIKKEQLTKDSVLLSPDIYYYKTNVSRLDINLHSEPNDGLLHVYMLEFTTDDGDEIEISLPETVKLCNGGIPVLTPNTTYQMTIINNMCTIIPFF